MMTRTLNAECDDAELVAASLAGRRDAFARIVERYQSLICSLAYSATGSLGQSEDLAQETFLTAWRQMPELREPAKLRSWLCGIVRCLIGKALRRDGREPVHRAEPIEAIAEPVALEPMPSEHLIGEEEAAILWRSLERIPEIYREPLILYYREHRSIEHVAVALELSEDAVKQRLSRGRRLLQEQVVAFIEGALERSTPGKVFTVAVLAALPGFATSATAASVGASVGASAAKGSALAKSAGLVAACGALFGMVTGTIGGYFTLRGALNLAHTTRERRAVIRQFVVICSATVVLILAVIGFVKLGTFWETRPRSFLALGLAIPITFGIWLWVMLLRYTRETRVIRAEERARDPIAFDQSVERSRRNLKEYRSRASLFGLPLVHIRLQAPDQLAGPVCAWIAVGDRAFGVLFALGAIAVGGVSIGTVSAGVISVGAVSLGFLSMATLAFGLFALGAVGIGVWAVGAYAIGWTAAYSGVIAMAHDYALAPVALALHANDALAQRYSQQHHSGAIMGILLLAVGVMSIAPGAWITWRTRRAAPPGPPDV